MWKNHPRPSVKPLARISRNKRPPIPRCLVLPSRTKSLQSWPRTPLRNSILLASAPRDCAHWQNSLCTVAPDLLIFELPALHEKKAPTDAPRYLANDARPRPERPKSSSDDSCRRSLRKRSSRKHVRYSHRRRCVGGNK